MTKTPREIHNEKVELYNAILADPTVSEDTKLSIKFELIERIQKKLI